MLARHQIRQFMFVLASSAALVSHAAAQSQTREGAALGGIAGAVIGGIVGHQNDEVAEGALIGGAVGAITGGVIGNARQKAQQQQQPQPYYVQPAPVYRSTVQQRTVAPYYTSSTTQVAPARKPVSIADVITLTRSGVNEGVILNQIHTNGVISNPEVNEVVLMHQQGVSNVVITAMQQANVGSPSTVTYTTPAPVIIEEHPAPVVVTRPVYSPPVYYHHQPYRTAQPYYYQRRGF